MTEENKTEEVTVEVVADEVVEAKTDALADIETKVDSIVAENAEQKAAIIAKDEAAQDMSAELETLTTELAVKAALVEELEAKSAMPAIIIKKDTPEMDTKTLVKTFMSEGLEGLQSKAADLQITVDAQGGFAVPEELRQEIIKIETEISPIRQVASVVTASTSDVRQLVSVGGTASGWVGETTSRTQTNASELAQRVATFGEVYARPRIYQHMLEDGFFNAEEWLANEVATQFAEAEGLSFLSGDGTNQPVGIIDGLTLTASAAAVDSTGTFEVIESATDGALGATDAAIVTFMRDIVLSAKTGYLPNAKFMMNRATHGVLANLKDSNGIPYINPDLSQAAGKQLFGHEIVINEDMDSSPTATGTNCVILFGDFKRAFQIVDRTGVTMLRDPYTNPGSVMFYTRKRVGSMVLDAGAMKVVSVSKT